MSNQSCNLDILGNHIAALLSITVYRRGNQYNVKVADPEIIRTKRSGKYCTLFDIL